MSHEIVWTAAARTHLSKEDGRGGAEGAGYGTGYGNVVLTRGMPPNLTRLLENLQAYRELPAAPREQQQSKPSPVEFLHFVGRYGGELLHVLGRRARAPSAGGRTNHIVHLVALQSTDFDHVPFEDSAGPAAEVLDQKWRWFKSWPYDAKPVFLEQSESPRPTLQASRRPPSFNGWMEHTGDAGWAGVLIDAFTAGQTIALIIPREGDWSRILVELYEEALQLLPATQRWQVGFSTYWTGAMPTGLKCHWRGMCADTEEAAIHRRNPRVITIDLCTPKRLSLTQTSRWIELARDYARPQPLPSPPRESRSADSSDSPVEVGSKPEHADNQALSTMQSETYGLSRAESQPAPYEDQVKRRRRWPIMNYWLWLGAGALALSLVIVVVVAFSGKATSTSETSAQTTKSELSSGQPRVQPPADQSNEPPVHELRDESKVAADRLPDPVSLTANPIQTGSLAPLPPVTSAQTQENVSVTPRVAVAKPFDDIRERKCRLPLPNRPKSTTQLGVPESPKPVELAALNVEKPSQLKLEVLGAHHWLVGVKKLHVVRLDGATVGWQISIKNTNTNGMEPIGEFLCDSGKLLFRHSSNKSLKDESAFAYCWIGLTYQDSLENDRVAFAIRPITKIDGGPFKLDGFTASSTIQKFKLPDLPEVQGLAQKKLKASFVPSSFLQNYLPKTSQPLRLGYGEPQEFDFHVGSSILPLSMSYTLIDTTNKKSKEAVTTAIRTMFLNNVDNQEAVTLTTTHVPTDKPTEYRDKVQHLLGLNKKRQNELRELIKDARGKKDQDQQVKQAETVLKSLENVQKAFEHNIRLVEEYDTAFQQLKSNGGINIQFRWDADDVLKYWPPAPEGSPPLDVLWSTSGN